MRAGVKCPGYDQQLKWSNKYEVFLPNGAEKAVRKTAGAPNAKKNDAEVPAMHVSDASNKSKSPVTPTNDQEHDEVAQGNPFVDDLSAQTTSPSHSLLNVPELEECSKVPELAEYLDFLDPVPTLDYLDTFDFSRFGEDSIDPLERHSPGDAPSLSQMDRSQGHWLRRGSTSFSTSASVSSNSISVPSLNRADGATDRSGFINGRLTSIAPSKSLNTPALVLVEFYFKETAQIFSCYDSKMNPFRTTVSRLWDSSPLLYSTLQSMAAASLVQDFPQLGALGRKLRKDAVELLDQCPSHNLDSLLAMLMLGGSASWHDPRDLGLSFFNRIRKCLSTMPASAFTQADVDYHFFHQSMTYWEMLLSYVAEDDTLDMCERPVMSTGTTPLHFVPHPWTGFARDTQNAVQQVGRLIRKQRKMAFSHRFASLAHIRQLEKDMATASELEQYLVNLSYPLEHTVVDPEDSNTPVWHLLTLAEVYRCSGLMQLYHIFPDLLDRRLSKDGLLDLEAHHDGVPGGIEHRMKLRNSWLTSSAVQVLSMMKSIPVESGTRDFQPFILVSLSSELRTPARVQSTGSSTSEAAPVDQLDGVNSHAIEISRMRHFVKNRLNSFLYILPPKPIHVCLDIITETWKRMDACASLAVDVRVDEEGLYDHPTDVYWMDVMIENGWETTMA
ncbi:unnamed protein product [Clonostachys solani]|uniref:Uncharacterized protein n=1 Tax=Clonostachys solani TaxID=160281 RepID=A0A9N9Z7X5_9HYPO|nr:unnamed protein product [Clonostachys solani]